MTVHETTPLASVLILTYNQEHLVSDTLKSVLQQRTSFPFEIVVGDDASADGTADLCEKLGAGFPLLRVLRHPINLGHVKNFHTTLNACRGRYVALLGGDDIWTDPTKLDRQVTFLRDNPGVVVSHTHNDLLIHATGEVTPRRFSSRRADGKCFTRLATEGNFVTASTAVFDQHALSDDEKASLKEFPTEDYPLWLTLAAKGLFHFIPEPCVRYRVIDGSLGRPRALEKRITGIEQSRSVALSFCKEEYTPLAQKINIRNDLDIIRMYIASGKREEARRFAKTIPATRLIRSLRLFRYYLKTL